MNQQTTVSIEYFNAVTSNLVTQRNRAMDELAEVSARFSLLSTKLKALEETVQSKENKKVAQEISAEASKIKEKFKEY